MIQLKTVTPVTHLQCQLRSLTLSSGRESDQNSYTDLTLGHDLLSNTQLYKHFLLITFLLKIFFNILIFLIKIFYMYN